MKKSSKKDRFKAKKEGFIAETAVLIGAVGAFVLTLAVIPVVSSVALGTFGTMALYARAKRCKEVQEMVMDETETEKKLLESGDKEKLDNFYKSKILKYQRTNRHIANSVYATGEYNLNGDNYEKSV